MEKIWLGIGSNLGDSVEFIHKAAGLIGEFVQKTRLSGLWISKARYYMDQPDFTNAVIAGETELSPQQLLKEINRVEATLGRDRSKVQPKGPRTIDIDILLFGDKIVVDDNLVIPHAGMRERKFVLLPLLELDEALIDPITQRPFRDFLAELPAQGIYPTSRGIYDAAYP
jgi:2-amino-4-hydroxy-6-hydroxymethyldihydropteridine diphosphokinase